MTDTLPIIHHECPRCNASIQFDEELQICDRCEWGLDAEPEATSDYSFTVDVESDTDARNAAHTLLTRLEQMAAEHPDTITRFEIAVTEVAHREQPPDDIL